MKPYHIDPTQLNPLFPPTGFSIGLLIRTYKKHKTLNSCYLDLREQALELNASLPKTFPFGKGAPPKEVLKARERDMLLRVAALLEKEANSVAAHDETK